MEQNIDTTKGSKGKYLNDEERININCNLQMFLK